MSSRDVTRMTQDVFMSTEGDGRAAAQTANEPDGGHVEAILCVRFVLDVNNSFSSKLSLVRALIEHRRLRRDEQQAYESTYYDLLSLALQAVVFQSRDTDGHARSGEYSSRFTFLCSLIPSLLLKLEEGRRSQDQPTSPTRGPLEGAADRFFKVANGDLEQCNTLFWSHEVTGGVDATQEQEEHAHIISQALVQALAQLGSLRIEQCPAILLSLPLQRHEDLPAIAHFQEAKDEGVSLDAFFEQRLVNGALTDEEFAQIVRHDLAAHSAFGRALFHAVFQLSNVDGVDRLSQICSAILSSEAAAAVEVLLTFNTPSAVLQPLAALLDNHDALNAVEDTSTFGSILLLSQHIARHGLRSGGRLESLLPSSQYIFLPAYLRSSTLRAVPITRLTADEQDILSNWITALFGSEGISDDLMRSSPPQVLLRITPTIFSQIVQAAMWDVIDIETVKGGLTYFLQDLLAYTLPGPILFLAEEVSYCSDIVTDRRSPADSKSAERRCTICIEILTSLLQADGCPAAVKSLVAAQVFSALKSVTSGSSAIASLCADMEAFCGKPPNLQSLNTNGWATFAGKLGSSISQVKTCLILCDSLSKLASIEPQSFALNNSPLISREMSRPQSSATLFAMLVGTLNWVSAHSSLNTRPGHSSDVLGILGVLDNLLASLEADYGMKLRMDLSRSLRSLAGYIATDEGAHPETDRGTTQISIRVASEFLCDALSTLKSLKDGQVRGTENVDHR